MKKRQNLLKLACKYLNSQAVIYAHLIKTSKSYATDLNQFLKHYSPGKIYLSITEFHQTWLTDSDIKGPARSWCEQDLLNWARSSQKSWSHLAPTSRNRKAACLKSFFKWMFQNKYIDMDVAQQISCQKVPRKLPNYLSIDEILSLNQVAQQPGQEVINALYLLLYGSGLRISEACSLKWSEIDLNQGSLRVIGKGEKQRVLGMPPLTVKALKNLHRRGEYVFGKSILDTRKAFNQVRNLGKAAGLTKPLNPHALRHSFATHMLASGTDIRIIQEMLGHSSLAATEKYTHLNLASLAQTMESHHPLGGKKN